MDRVWHIRRDGKAFPVEVHYYCGDEAYDQTAFCAEWMWGKCIKEQEFESICLSFLHSWLDLQFDGDLDAMYAYVLEQDEYFCPSIDFIKDKSEQFINAPVGNIKELNNQIRYILNNDFIRARYGGTFDDEGYKEIVFRVASEKFNWFNVIYMFVIDNRRSMKIEYVTIVNETADEGWSDEPYVDRGITFQNVPIDEFLAIEHTPLIEQDE